MQTLTPCIVVLLVKPRYVAHSEGLLSLIFTYKIRTGNCIKSFVASKCLLQVKIEFLAILDSNDSFISPFSEGRILLS